MTRFALRLLVLSLAWTPCALWAQAPESAGESMLVPGDSLRIVVWRRPEMSGDFVVDQNGNVTHPLYRDVKVANVPFRTAEANLRTFLQQFDANPQFVMEPLLRVAVSGEVGRPSVYAMQPRTTLAEAVARAGGVGQNGQRQRVRIFRGTGNGVQVLTMDVTQPDKGAGALPIRSGDQILVDRRGSFFRDILVPALGIIGSVASLGLLIDRYSRN